MPNDMMDFTAIPELRLCGICGGNIADLGDEMACTTCGTVYTKEIIPTKKMKEHERHGTLGAMLTERDRNALRESLDLNTDLRPVFGNSEKTRMRIDELVKGASKHFHLTELVTEQVGLMANSIVKRTPMSNDNRRINIYAVTAYALYASTKMFKLTNVTWESAMRFMTDGGHRVTAKQMTSLATEFPIDSTSASEMVDKWISRCANIAPTDKGGEIYVKAKELATRFKDSSGHSPRTIAAACAYTVAKQMGLTKITQKRCAEAVGVTETSVRNFHKFIFGDFLFLRGKSRH